MGQSTSSAESSVGQSTSGGEATCIGTLDSCLHYPTKMITYKGIIVLPDKAEIVTLRAPLTSMAARSLCREGCLLSTLYPGHGPLKHSDTLYSQSGIFTPLHIHSHLQYIISAHYGGSRANKIYRYTGVIITKHDGRLRASVYFHVLGLLASSHLLSWGISAFSSKHGTRRNQENKVSA